MSLKTEMHPMRTRSGFERRAQQALTSPSVSAASIGEKRTARVVASTASGLHPKYPRSSAKLPFNTMHAEVRRHNTSIPAFTATVVFPSANLRNAASTAGSSNCIKPRVFHGVCDTNGLKPQVSWSLDALLRKDAASWQ